MSIRVYLDTSYFAENWKHCSKIIFKCINSTVRPIFNESFAEKRGHGSREQCTKPTENALALLKRASQKKKKRRHKIVLFNTIQTDT